MSYGDTLLHDLRYALRSLRKSPGFTIVAVLTLGLGIGAATAIFSVVNTMILRPLPLDEPDRLVRMRDAVARDGQEPWLYNTSPRSFFALRDRAAVFDGVVAQRFHVFNLTGSGDPIRVEGIGVSSDWAEVVGVQPILGRSFSPEEERRGGDARVALVGHGLWQRRFGADPGVVGSTLTLNGEPYTVLGVMPLRFNYPYGAQIWVPETFDPSDTAFGPNVAARLAPGVSIDEAQRALDQLSARLGREFPDSHASLTLTAVPMREDLLGDQARLSLILLGAVGFLLMITCVNVANLMLARSMARAREFAIRTALGAGRGRQVRQLLTETMCLAMLAVALGLLLAFALTDSMAVLSLPESDSFGSFFQDVRVDGRVLGFSLLVALVTALFFGMLPALWKATPDPHAVLQKVGRASTASGHRPLKTLVVAEIALAMVLLAGAALMVRDFQRLQSVDPGYEADGRVAFHLTLPRHAFPETGDRVRFVERMLDRVQAVPGVLSAGVTNLLPLREGSTSSPVTIEGGPASEPGRQILVNTRTVTAGYLATMGTPLLRGRSFDVEEERGETDAVVVSRRQAERYWPGEDPVGRRLKIGGLETPGPWLTVVGVAGDVAEGYEIDATMYTSYARSADENPVLVVRTQARPAALIPALRDAIREIDPDQPTDRVATMPDLVENALSGSRLGTRIMGIFAAVGLLLAALGVYGVISHAVGRRRHEIGIRAAIGATPGTILKLVLGWCTGLAGVGILVGLPVSLFTSRLLSGFLEVPGSEVPVGLRDAAGAVPIEPAVYALLALLILAVVLLAASIPARRAARVDPLTALRAE